MAQIASTAPMYEMVGHLLLGEGVFAQPFSRNRNFEAFRDKRFRTALALYRRLRALLNDLEQAHAEGGRLAMTEEIRAGRPSVRLDITSERARRTAWLDKPAFDVLMRHPAARAHIALLSGGSGAARLRQNGAG